MTTRRYRSTTDAGRAAEKKEHARDVQRRKKLLAALCALPGWQRQAFLLRRYDGASAETIARAIGHPPAEVEAAIAQAIEATAGLLGDALTLSALCVPEPERRVT